MTKPLALYQGNAVVGYALQLEPHSANHAAFADWVGCDGHDCRVELLDPTIPGSSGHDSRIVIEGVLPICPGEWLVRRSAPDRFSCATTELLRREFPSPGPRGHEILWPTGP